MSTVHGRTAQSHIKSKAQLDSGFFLEIARGKTTQPVRPISGDRFLIGAGDWCDLCLSGPEMPVLHSVIHLDGENAWIDAVASGLKLRVNDRPTSFAELHAGDRIEIGSFALTFKHNSAKAPKVPVIAAYDPIPEDLEDDPEVDLSKLSAAELVDLIEDDMELVEEFERRKRRGTEALLDAVRRHRSDEVLAHEIAPAKVAGPIAGFERLAQLFNDLESTIASIGTLAKDLEQRSKELNPAEFSAAAESLLQFQEQVVSRLDEVLEKVARQNKAIERRTQRRDAA